MNDRLQTAGLVPFFQKDGDIYIFMQMRDEHAKRWPNTWGFFGGALEEGETPLDAVKREIEEELSIAIPDPIFFKHYDGEIADTDVFLLEVPESFSEQVVVREGKYGKFLTLSGMSAIDLREHYRKIMKDLSVHFNQDGE